MRRKIIMLAAIAMIAAMSGGGEASAANGYDVPLQTEVISGGSTVTLTMDAKPAGEDNNLGIGEANSSGKAIRRTASIKLGNTSGYTVSIKGNSNLTGEKSNSIIPSVTSATTLRQISDAWGWTGNVGDNIADCSDSSLTFKAMSATEQELGSGGAVADGTKKVTMCFGARITDTKVADTYSNTVTLSVVAEPGKIATFGGITTMQELTPAICKAASINDTAFLEDTRDRVNGVAGTGTKYWVTKLLDGNCWMSQNLDFNISTSNVTTATSDVTSNWTTSSAYPPQTTTTSVTTGSTSNTGTYSWDLGDYVIINPTATTACSSNDTGLSACTGQFIAVGSRTPSTDPNFYQKNGATYNAMEYDAHYLAGNYYQWNAATAGTGGTITNENATGSICPKNWKLPNSSSTFNDTSGSFYYLLSQYGVSSSLSGTSSVNSNTYNIALSPLFFVQGGYVYPLNHLLWYVGQRGFYWSSRAYSNTGQAYYLSFVASGVGPSGSPNRYIGHSLRCLILTT